MADQTAADLSTLLDVPGMARAKRENEELRDALVRASAALERVTVELAEAYCMAAEEFAAACAVVYDREEFAAACAVVYDRLTRAASDLAARITETGRTDG